MIRTMTFGVLLAMSLLRVSQATTVVRFETSLGTFNVDLFDDTAPRTVANFLTYVADGDYTNSLVHRSLPGFIIHGGGFYSDLSPIPTDAPIDNEFNMSNTRGTIGMAKLSGQPDSATSQWFINLADNPSLDEQNGGFTVFGQVIGDGMSVVDAVAALDRDLSDVNGPFLRELPVLDGSLPPEQIRLPTNLVQVHQVFVVPEPSGSALLVGLAFCWLGVLRVLR